MKTKRLFRNRKGVIADNVYWILNIALLAIIILMLNWGINSSLTGYQETYGLEHYVLNQRVLNAMAYTDPTSSVTHQDIIDISLVSDDVVKQAIHTEDFNHEFGIMVLLEYEGKEEKAHFNKENYDDFRIFKAVILKKHILVKDGDKYFNGVIEIAQAMRR